MNLSLMFRWRLALPIMIVSMMLVVACGADDSSPGSSANSDSSSNSSERDASEFIIESDTTFSIDDIKALGWKEQRDFALDYPESTDAKWGFINTKELGVLVYPSAAIAQVQGAEAALTQTALGPDGKSIGVQDRISCRQAQGQSAVGLVDPVDSTGPADGSRAFRISFSSDTSVEQKICANKYPKYRDFRILGNIVLLCEGDGRTGDQPAKNCKDLPGQLQGN